MVLNQTWISFADASITCFPVPVVFNSPTFVSKALSLGIVFVLTETQASMKNTKYERGYHEIGVPAIGSFAPDPRSEE